MTLEQLSQAIEETRAKVAEMHEATVKQWLSQDELCALYLGRSTEWLRTHPWAAPEPMLPDPPYRYSRDVCREFYADFSEPVARERWRRAFFSP